MITKELESYVKSLLEQGYEKEFIRTLLLKDGDWTREDTVEVFNAIDGVVTNKKETTKDSSEKDNKKEKQIFENVKKEKIVPFEKKPKESSLAKKDIKREEVKKKEKSDLKTLEKKDSALLESKKELPKVRTFDSEANQAKKDKSTHFKKGIIKDSLVTNREIKLKKHAQKHVSVVFSFLVLFFVLIAGGVYGYMNFFPDVEKEPISLTPFEVFESVLESDNASSLRVNTKLIITGDVALPKKVTEFSYDEGDNVNGLVENSETFFYKCNIEIGQVVDISSADRTHAEGSFSLNLSGIYSFMNFNFDAVIDFKFLDKAYIRFREVTPLPFLGNLDLIKNKWIEIDLDELVTGFDSEDGKDRVELFENLDLQVVKEWINRVVVVDDADNLINNTPVYYYTVQLTPDDWDMLIKGFSNGLEDFIVNLSSNEKAYLFEQDLSTEDLQGLNQLFIEGYDEFKNTPEYQDLLQAFSEIKVKMWIGKDDFYIHKLTIDFDLDEFLFLDTLVNSTFEYTQENSEFNEFVNILPPEEFTILDEVVELYNTETVIPDGAELE